MGHNVKVVTTRGYAVLKGTPQSTINEISKGLVKAMKHETFGTYLKVRVLIQKLVQLGLKFGTSS